MHFFHSRQQVFFNSVNIQRLIVEEILHRNYSDNKTMFQNKDSTQYFSKAGNSNC